MIPGDACTWLHVPRGGYGYTVRVPAEIVRVTGARVRIRARRADGSMAERTVQPESLRLRCKFCHGRREANIYDGTTGMVRERLRCDRCDERGEVSADPRRNGGG